MQMQMDTPQTPAPLPEPAPPETAARPEQPESIIAPARGWQLINVRELWQFRELVYFLVWRDVKVRYKQTLLGIAWSVLQPAMMMVVFTLFFNRVAGLKDDSVPYPVFVLCGLLPWSFFTTGLVNAGNSVVGSERLITKVYFPRLAVPFAAVGSAVVDFLMAFGLLFVVMLIYQVPPAWGLLLTPLVLVVIGLAAAGFGTLLAALNVAYRDVRYVIPFLVQLWIFATPTVFMPLPPAEAGSWLHTLLSLNPLNSLVAAFRAAILGREIDWIGLALSTALVVVVFVAGCLYFRRVEDSFADVI
jgi:lipopolysaccharide transport system permease protein